MYVYYSLVFSEELKAVYTLMQTCVQEELKQTCVQEELNRTS